MVIDGDPTGTLTIYANSTPRDQAAIQSRVVKRAEKPADHNVPPALYEALKFTW